MHMMLKRGKIMRKEDLVNKTQPRKDWASFRYFDKLKKKCKPHEMMKTKFISRGLQSSKYCICVTIAKLTINV